MIRVLAIYLLSFFFFISFFLKAFFLCVNLSTLLERPQPIKVNKAIVCIELIHTTTKPTSASVSTGFSNIDPKAAVVSEAKKNELYNILQFGKPVVTPTKELLCAFEIIAYNCKF